MSEVKVTVNRAAIRDAVRAGDKGRRAPQRVEREYIHAGKGVLIVERALFVQSKLNKMAAPKLVVEMIVESSKESVGAVDKDGNKISPNKPGELVKVIIDMGDKYMGSRLGELLRAFVNREEPLSGEELDTFIEKIENDDKYFRGAKIEYYTTAGDKGGHFAHFAGISRDTYDGKKLRTELDSGELLKRLTK